MENLSIGQVVLAAFPFSDLTSTKLRPCLVIGLVEFNYVLVCQITSREYGSKTAVKLFRADFKDGGLALDSFVRTDKIATLDRIRINRTLGRINDSKLIQIKLSLKNILEIT
jgi:mRNA interferase MazF